MDMVFCSKNMRYKGCKFLNNFYFFRSILELQYLTACLQINWSNRITESDTLIQNCFASVDGTDCRINEPFPFDSKWYSHKFHGPGLRYEIGLANHSGNIVWVNGPFPCGSYPDIKIFKEKMVHHLQHKELIVGDNGYIHSKCITPGDVSEGKREIHKLLRARHETVNERLKNFNIIKHIFRHHVSLHSLVFHSVANLTFLLIDHGDDLFEVLP